MDNQSKPNRICIGSDHGGFSLKNTIVEHLKNMDIEVFDVGCFDTNSCDYPVIAKKVVKKVLNEKYYGILVCGTGIGMSIVANRFDGIRASHCTDTFSVRMTKMHNDSNIHAFCYYHALTLSYGFYSQFRTFILYLYMRSVNAKLITHTLHVPIRNSVVQSPSS